MPERERFVAATLLTQRDLDRWAPSLRNIFPLNDADDFADLLRAIDEAETVGQRPATD